MRKGISYGAWITDERDALMRELVPQTPFTAIYERVCQLPGLRPPGIESVRNRAYRTLKLTPLRTIQRAERAAQKPPPPPPPPPPPQPPVAVTVVDDSFGFRQAVTWTQLLRIADEWGITVRDWEDMPLVNDHAERIGRPGYKRRFR